MTTITVAYAIPEKEVATDYVVATFKKPELGIIFEAEFKAKLEKNEGFRKGLERLFGIPIIGITLKSYKIFEDEGDVSEYFHEVSGVGEGM